MKNWMLTVYQNVHNFIHLRVMNLYALRASVDASKAIWAFYTADELYLKARKIKDTLGMDPARVLELGCGTGILLKPFYEGNSEIYGVDFNVRIARRTYPKGHFFAQDVLAFLESNQLKFDLIIIHGVIGCLPLVKQKQVLQRSIAALNSGGHVWLGATQYDGDAYIFHSYTMNEEFIRGVAEECAVEMTVYNEWDYFGLTKYCKDQRTILLRKS